MEKSSAVTMVVLVAMVAGFLAPSAFASPAHLSSTTTVSAPSVGTTHGGLQTLSAGVAPSDTGATYPRTVLAEAFTAQWCVWCPEESKAMYTIEHQNSHSVVSVSELHVCYSSMSCGDNYNTPDATSAARQVYYSVSGIPTVVFDGVPEVGSNANETQLLATYENDLATAESTSSPMLLSERAWLTASSQVSVQLNVTSAIGGTFHAETYLVELIDKNISSTGGVHDIENVVRSSVVNQNVALTAGTTTLLTGLGALNASWNSQNLSVVSFVQDNATKAIENVNMAPVSDLLTNIAESKSTLSTGVTTQITVTAVNASSGATVSGAAVMLSSVGGGSFSPSSGTTGAMGTFTSTYTAPAVTQLSTVEIGASVTAAGYLPSQGASLVSVNPLAPPTTPLALTVVSSGSPSVNLSWSAPTSGGAGITYHIYRTVVATVVGPFQPIGVTPGTSFVDSNVQIGQSYEYEISAQNAGGFSSNTSILTANSVQISSEGLPTGVGWSLDLPSMSLSAASSASIALFLANGQYDYTVSAHQYEYIAQQSSDVLSVSGAPVSVLVPFVVRLATLTLSVTPADSTVTVGGTAIPVSGGVATDASLYAGNYKVVVTHSGYVTNSSTAILTWGNTTSLTVALSATPNSPGGGTPGGGSGSGSLGLGGGVAPWAFGAILAAIVVVGAAIVMAVYMSPRRRQGVGPSGGSSARSASGSNSSGATPPKP